MFFFKTLKTLLTKPLFNNTNNNNNNNTTLLSLLITKPSIITTIILISRGYLSASAHTLYSQISPIGDPSISITPVLDKWVDDGKTVSKFEIRRILRDLRRRRRYSHALQMAEWMSSKGFCSMLAGDRAMQMDLIGKVHGLNAAEIFFEELNEEEKNEKTYGALLNCYVREGRANKSISLMQKMEELGFVTSTLTFNDLMCLFNRTGQLDKIPEVFSLIKKKGLHPDNYSYRICMNAYGTKSDLENMELLLEEMKTQPHLKMDWNTYSTIASLYIKFGLKEKAVFYLKKLEDKTYTNALAYNHLISHYANLGNKTEMKRFWSLQKVACKKQLNRDYINMLGALVKIDELEEANNILKEWESSCKFYDFRVPNVLVIGYCKKGLIDKAEELIVGIVGKGKTPSPNSYAIIASAYLDEENMEKSTEFLKKALKVKGENVNWRPKPLLESRILKWVGEKGDVESEEEFLDSLNKLDKVDNKEIHDEEEMDEDDIDFPKAEQIR